MFDTQRPDIAEVTIGWRTEKVKKAKKFYRWYREADNCFQTEYPDVSEAFDYFESNQFSETEKMILGKRGQPATVVNKTRVGCELVMGMFDRTRMDANMLPRGKGTDDFLTAQSLTYGSKYVEDANSSPHEFRLGFFDALVGGRGWLESVLSEDPTREEIEERYVNWRNIRRDPLSTKDNYSDARYLFRPKWMHLDEAINLFPEHETVLRESSGKDVSASMGSTVAGDDDFMSVAEIRETGWQQSDWIESARDRVLLLECWYYEHGRASFIRDRRTGRILEYDPTNPTKAQTALIIGGVTGALPVEILKDRPIRRCRQAIMVGPHVLFDKPSPYAHGRIPFTPIIAWKGWEDGRPIGLVKILMDPQDAANKALAKLILALSSRRVIAEEGVGDLELIRKQAARPDGFIQTKRGAVREGRIKIEDNTSDAAGHQAIFQMFDSIVSEMSGGLELSGQSSDANSGRAIALRQEQGFATLSTLFENYRYAKKSFIEMRLANMQQFWTDEKSIRITESADPDRQEFIIMNERQPDGSIRNDLTSLRADVVIDEQSARASVRQAFADRLMDFLTRMPDPIVAMSMMDIVVDLYDLPDRPVIKQRIQMIQQQMGIQVQENMRVQAELDAEKVGDTKKTTSGPTADMPTGGGDVVGYTPSVQANLKQADQAAGNINQGR